MQSELYGRGLAFPVSLNAAGGLQESAGADKVEQSIRVILGTQYGERLMRPRFGCNLKSIAFAPNNRATANLARYYVEEGLRQWEPRVDILDILVENSNGAGALLIHIHYRLRATQEAHSMIYPFYLQER
jgi:phage baseplate assembly protein W